MTSTVKGFQSKSSGIGSIFEGVYLIEGARTPFGSYTGALSTISPTDLGILASRAALKRSNIPGSEIAQTIVANIGQASCDSFFLPRHIGLYSGAPMESPASLIQRICGSGIEVLGHAAEQIALNKGNLILACGTDTMSRFPLVSYSARQGFPLGRPEYKDLLWEALNDTAAVPMGETADNVAKEFKLTRSEVDEFCLRSQQRYAKALEDGVYADEIISIEKSVIECDGLKPRKIRLNRAKSLDHDEHPRTTTLEKLSTLPYVFTKEGPTTAASSSGIVDGAASALVASEDFVKTNGSKPLGLIRGIVSIGVEPALMGLGPVPAIKTLLGEFNLTQDDIDIFEINEAFGAQCLGVAKALELDQEKLNVNGGAIAIGHPLAATGIRLAVTCLKNLRRTDKKRGIVSACIGGGQGIAMLLETC